MDRVEESGTIQHFFCKRKEHGDSRASPIEIKDALETYMCRLAYGIVEANILAAVNSMFNANSTIEERRNLDDSGHAVKLFPQAPVIDSETGYRVMLLCENEDICPESSESSIYLMQNLRVGDLNCRKFF